MRLPMAPTDSMFLLGESRDHPMHVGGLLIFQPRKAPDAPDLRRMFVDALARDDTAAASVWRRRPVRSLLTLGQWAWEEDPRFSADYHVRFNALPSPGTMDTLWELVSRLHASLLDRSRPLWEMHLIEGLPDHRYALYVKIHHALADGVGAMRLLRHALGTDPDRVDMPAPWAVPDGPATTRSPVGTALGFPVAALRATLGAVTESAHLVSEAVGVVPALIGTVDRALHRRGGPLSFRAPRTILNESISGSRRFAARSWSLERLRLVAKAADVTVNDVVLELSGGALRAFLAEQGALPDEPLVAMVPVSLRPEADVTGSSVAGNDIGLLMCTLGTECEDPKERLERVGRSMSEGKRAMSGMSKFGRLAMSAIGIAPLALGVLTGNRALPRPPFNLIVSNVRGPETPLYWNGARVDAVYPLSVPVDGQALNITCTSTDDEIAFGLTACGRTIPHLPRLLDHLDVELSALEDAFGIGSS